MIVCEGSVSMCRYWGAPKEDAVGVCSRVISGGC